MIDARYGAPHKLGLALHMGFLRLSGRSLNAVRDVPVSLWTHLGKELGVQPPERKKRTNGQMDYDHCRPHGSLGNRTPSEYVRKQIRQPVSGQTPV